MAYPPQFIVQAYRRRRGHLAMAEAYLARDEEALFRRGRAMQSRVDGMVFFRIETGPDGDVWTRVELLATDGDVPEEEA